MRAIKKSTKEYEAMVKERVISVVEKSFPKRRTQKRCTKTSNDNIGLAMYINPSPYYSVWMTKLQGIDIEYSATGLVRYSIAHCAGSLSTCSMTIQVQTRWKQVMQLWLYSYYLKLQWWQFVLMLWFTFYGQLMGYVIAQNRKNIMSFIGMDRRFSIRSRGSLSLSYPKL